MKLLLRGHQFLWFLQSICQVHRRYKISRRMVLWEPVGAVKYAYLYLTEALRWRLDRSLIRPRSR